MIKFNKKTIYFKTLNLLSKYKIICIVYLAIVCLIYPVFFFLTDYKTKIYNLNTNYVDLLTVSNNEILNIIHLNKKINNGIQYQLELINIGVSINCSLIEYKNNCVLKVKNWTLEKNKLIQNIIINSHTKVINAVKEQFEDRINLLDAGLRNSKAFEGLLDDYVNLIENQEANFEKLEDELELKLKVTEYSERTKKDLLILKKDLLTLIHIIKKLDIFKKNISMSYSNDFENIKFSSFENYSFKKHILSIILGSGLLFFGLLTALI